MKILSTRGGRFMLAFGMYCVAYVLVIALTNEHNPKMPHGVVEIPQFLKLHLTGLFLVFPMGFGFQRLDNLFLVPHLIYVVLIMAATMARTIKRFIAALAFLAMFLSVNIYGCVYTPHTFHMWPKIERAHSVSASKCVQVSFFKSALIHFD